MRDLREEVVDNVGADIMVNVVNDAVVSVDCGQRSSEVAPFLIAEVNIVDFCKEDKSMIVVYLSPVPWKLVVVAMVVQVGHKIEPRDEHLQDKIFSDSRCKCKFINF